MTALRNGAIHGESVALAAHRITRRLWSKFPDQAHAVRLICASSRQRLAPDLQPNRLLTRPRRAGRAERRRVRGPANSRREARGRTRGCPSFRRGACAGSDHHRAEIENALEHGRELRRVGASRHSPTSDHPYKRTVTHAKFAHSGAGRGSPQPFATLHESLLDRHER